MKRMNQETKEILHKLNIDIDPREQVSELAVSKQQMVEIAKALSQNAKVLIMMNLLQHLHPRRSMSCLRSSTS